MTFFINIINKISNLRNYDIYKIFILEIFIYIIMTSFLTMLLVKVINPYVGISFLFILNITGLISSVIFLNSYFNKNFDIKIKFLNKLIFLVSLFFISSFLIILIYSIFIIIGIVS